MKKLKIYLTVIISLILIFSALVPLYAIAAPCCNDCCELDPICNIIVNNSGISEFIIQDPTTSLARGFEVIDNGQWALVNLILCAAGIALAVLMAIKMVFKTNPEEDSEKNQSRRLLVFAIPVIALLGTVLFFLTQDMNLTMGIVNSWTAPQTVLFISGLMCYIFAERKAKEENDQTTTA